MDCVVPFPHLEDATLAASPATQGRNSSTGSSKEVSSKHSSPTCNCSLEDQTAKHTLQRCPLLQSARTNVWPAAVQLHTTLYGSPDTHHTIWLSSYTPHSMAVQLHTKLYGCPVTHHTLWQSSYTPNSMAVQLHTILYGSPATHQTLWQSSYTPNSTAARRKSRRRPQSSCRLDSLCSSDQEEEEESKYCDCF